MGNVLHTIYPFEYLTSVHTPNYYGGEWLIAEEMASIPPTATHTAVALQAMHNVLVASGLDPFYYLYIPEQALVRPMTTAEMDAKDVADPSFLDAKKREYIAAAKEKARVALEEEYDDTDRDVIMAKNIARAANNQAVTTQFSTMLDFMNTTYDAKKATVQSIKACTSWNQLQLIAI